MDNVPATFDAVMTAGGARATRDEERRTAGRDGEKTGVQECGAEKQKGPLKTE